MTLPAARITDPTTHGGTITLGMPTVLIGSMPASRLGDIQTCPLTTGVVPHATGPIIFGAFNVLTCGSPQARQTDPCICVGPPTTVMLGHTQTLVGMAGLFAGGIGGFLSIVFARQLPDRPYPRTVRRPDGTVDVEYGPGITIMGSPEYQAAVIEDLNNPINSDIVDELNSSGRHVYIQPIPESMTQANGFTRWLDDGARAQQLYDDNSIDPGDGSDSEVYYNPTFTMRYRGEDGEEHEMPPAGILGHELGHANHNADGENLAGWSDSQDPHGNQEEARNQGNHGWEDEPISERQASESIGNSPRGDHDSGSQYTYQDTDGQWYEQSRDENGHREDPVPIDAPNDRQSR